MTDDFHKQTTLPDLHTGQSRIALPKKIGPYQVESLLNKGGMSFLYLAIHPETGQTIVVKVLVPKFLKNKEMAERFLNEAQIIGMSNHPNIVRLYGQGEWEKGLYIAMEFIQGISLRQFIQQKSLSQKRALEIVLQVAYALYHLHTHGVIHRDLKPENILITETGDIKVIDFGIAQLRGDLQQERITQKKRIMGTPIYMSPEQKENPSKVSYSSDIYSLGIIAYELILGRLSHGVIDLSLLPKKLRTILEKALQPDLAKRYGDIVDFITDISQYLKNLGEEPEEREMDISDEILEMIDQTREILTPQKGPSWPQLEVGIGVDEGIYLNGLYLDFFSLSENRYGILLAEPLKSGIGSLVHAAIFRGMARMAFQNEKNPLKALQVLNEALHLDPMGEHFALSWLTLMPEKNQLSFVSCQSSTLWHLSEGSREGRFLNTTNPALGVDPAANLLETTDNWNAGDTLILHSFQNNAGKDFSWIGEFSLFPPQVQSEKILQKIRDQKRALQKKVSAVIVIQRVF